MRIGRAGKRVLVEPGERLVDWIGQVARHLLLDGAAFLVPFRLGVVDAGHAGRVDAERDVDVFGRHRCEVLRDSLLCLGIAVPAQFGEGGGRLIAGDAGAATERHVFLGMCGARKVGGRFVAADEVGVFDSCHWRERIAHDHDPQAVRQRRARDVGCRARLGALDRGANESRGADSGACVRTGPTNVAGEASHIPCIR